MVGQGPCHPATPPGRHQSPSLAQSLTTHAIGLAIVLWHQMFSIRKDLKSEAPQGHKKFNAIFENCSPTALYIRQPFTFLDARLM